MQALLLLHRALALRSRVRPLPLLAIFVVAASSLVVSASTDGAHADEAGLRLSPTQGPPGAVITLRAPMPAHSMAIVHWDAGTANYDAQAVPSHKRPRPGAADAQELQGTLSIPVDTSPGEHVVSVAYTDGTTVSAKFLVTGTATSPTANRAHVRSTATATKTVKIPRNEGLISINTPTRTPTSAPASPTYTSTSSPRPPTSTSTPVPPTPTPPASSGTRDKFKQPFASTSIWNMPIGSSASYAWAGIHDWTSWGVFLEENIIINRPWAPLTPVYYNGDGWSGGSRCFAQGGVVFSAPLPAGYIIPGAGNGDTPNYAAAIMTSDTNSYIQGQPLTHCTSSGPWTTLVQNATVSLYGDGILGAQGGSHLSSAGGTIRLGEWHARAIKHALKTVLDPSNYSQTTGGFRWPAVSADAGYQSDYAGTNPAVKMGTLLALRPDFNIAQLQTEPGRIVARAMMDYGCYIVDSGWAPAYLPVEQGPDGNAADEFQQEFGFPMADSNANSPWSTDWRTIMTNTYVVNNNGATSVGGGGQPRVPLAAPIGN